MIVLHKRDEVAVLHIKTVKVSISSAQGTKRLDLPLALKKVDLNWHCRENMD